MRKGRCRKTMTFHKKQQFRCMDTAGMNLGRGLLSLSLGLREFPSVLTLLGAEFESDRLQGPRSGCELSSMCYGDEARYDEETTRERLSVIRSDAFHCSSVFDRSQSRYFQEGWKGPGADPPQIQDSERGKPSEG